MSTTQIILTALILFLGSGLQGAVGFGFALFAIPALIWVGIPLKDAVALMSVTMLVQVVFALYQLRHEIVWPDVWRPLLIVYASLPIGIGLLMLLSNLDPASIKQVIGGLMLVVVTVQIIGRVELRERLHFGWTVLAFGASGLFSGMVSIGGPPIVLWVMAHRWTAQRARAFIFVQLFFAVLLQILLLYLSFGAEIVINFVIGAAFLPLVGAGSLLGVRWGNRLPHAQLRHLTFALIIVMATVFILTP